MSPQDAAPESAPGAAVQVGVGAPHSAPTTAEL